MKKQEYLDYVNHFKTFDPNSPVHVEILDIVLKKFNSLTDNDKLYILLNYHDSESNNCKANDNINAEVADIEKENMIEMVRLRMWFIKMFVTVLVVILLGSLLLGVIGGATASTSVFKDWFDYTVNLYNILFK